MRARVSLGRALLAALGFAVLAAPALWAHGTPLPLEAWGGFSPSAARCQRALGQAASQCALGVWEARRPCIEAELAGLPCDSNATALAVRQARDHARERVQRACAGGEVTSLQFLDLAEALADVISVCRQLETALVSAVYGPSLLAAADIVLPADASTRACLAGAADSAGEILRQAGREQRRALDHIATRSLPAAAKQHGVARARQRIAAAGAAFAARTAARCDDATFQALYRRDIAAFAADLAGRAECLAGGVYVQGEVVCPAARCGNGMKEPTEDCDDLNSDDADGCRADCRLAECDTYAGTWDAIQQTIFAAHGCSDDACHGEMAGGGLDLRPDVSYNQLVNSPSTSTPLARVEPGDAERSRLFLLLAKATLGRADVPGRAMPIDLPALSVDQLEAVRLWIQATAPRQGSVPGTAALLGICLPPPPTAGP